MQAFQDPGKKTSIVSLLNPQERPHSFPSVLEPSEHPSQSHSHSHRATSYGNTYTAGDFSLRKATWESNDRTPHTEGEPRYHSPYSAYHHQPSRVTAPHSPDSYYEPQHYHYSERPILRSDRVEGRYENTPQWQSQTYPMSSHYQTQVAHSSYSDTNHAPTNQFRSTQHTQSSSHRDHSDSPQSSHAYQGSDRASVRLAARGTAPDQVSDIQSFQFSPSPPSSGPQDNAYPSPKYQSMIVLAPPQAGSSDITAVKRPLPEEESTPAPKVKKARKRGKSTTSDVPTPPTSRRGYNAKKRQEAAHIAAQNAIAFRNVHSPDGSIFVDGVAFVPELQFARCMSARYKDEQFTRCVACTRRWAGDTCRFQGIRYIIRDSQQKFVGISFSENASLTETSKMEFPGKWNRNFTLEHVRRCKLSIAKALLPILRIEQQHISTKGIVRRQRETEVRVTCDTCMTSLFSTSFMCRHCGREVCNECFQIVKELTEPDKPGDTADELSARRKMRERHAHSNPFFLSCLKRNEHTLNDFIPVTRFAVSELEEALRQMEFILEKHVVETGMEIPPQEKRLAYSDILKDPTTPFPDPITSPVYDDHTPTNTPSEVASIPIHRAQIIPASLYDPPPWNHDSTAPTPSFSSLWQRGTPLLVKDVLSRFKMNWSPEYLVQKCGDKTCVIVECQTDQNQKVSIRKFFDWFGKYEDRLNCWKLKDWPPTAEFKNVFPELYEDFSNAVPVPDYVRRDGVYNVGSHFPSNALGPDLGPKMYNSLATSQDAGSKGTTRLHMDMADAFNVMVFSSDCADGTPGYAVWDLYHAEDSDKIRDFLRKKFTPGPGAMAMTNGHQQQQTPAAKAAALQTQANALQDPIHSQQFYLDVDLRRQLWEEYGVKSFRIHQRPGEGVFIPAGCAHQVANMADCMKIAIDFVSPENIDHCEQLTKEFREQNQRKAWKEDVLQLRTMMWFAWQSCSKREGNK